MTTIKDSILDNVKENAIIIFSEDLKTEMTKVASSGMNNGSMQLNHCKYSELSKILSLHDTRSIYYWILEQFKERKMFDDVDFAVSIIDENNNEYDLQFCWYFNKIEF